MIPSTYQRRSQYNYHRAALAKQMATRQQHVMRSARTDAKRLVAADAALADGDVNIACRLYLRVAASRPPNPASVAAKAKLVQLQAEAKQKMDELEQKLADVERELTNRQYSSESMESLFSFLSEYDDLSKQYRRVPAVGRDLDRSLTKRKRQPHVRAALHEPEAKRLWTEAQSLEQHGQTCCAMLLYEEALHEIPAPSAQLAQERLEYLRSDANNVAAAESCRNLQWCHEQYNSAERLVAVKPRVAREKFEQIVKRAPADSKIHQEAKDQIARLF